MTHWGPEQLHSHCQSPASNSLNLLLPYLWLPAIDACCFPDVEPAAKGCKVSTLMVQELSATVVPNFTNKVQA